MLLHISFCTLFLWLSALNESQYNGKVIPGEETASKQYRVDPSEKIIARNSEPVKAVARDRLSVKNFDVLAFDWSINFQVLFVEQEIECKMATRDHPASAFFF